MSRIDEALRKASKAATDPWGLEEVPPRSDRRSDLALDTYPRERRQASAERPAAAVAPVREVAAAVPSAPVAAVVQPAVPAAVRMAPKNGGKPDHEPFGADFEGKLVAGHPAAQVSVEQYRRLAASMHELQVDRGLKTLMITSTLPREGKTLTITNLALTLSGSYRRRVLLIDADLRRPTIHDVLNVPNRVGLSDVLRSGRTELPVIQHSPLLSVLPAGTSDNDPMALLTSSRMTSLLEEAAARYDWVLLDAPPVGFMPDASLLASITGAILFVISAGSTPYPLIQRATAQLGRDNIVGTVLNRIEARNIPATGYYSEYYAEQHVAGR